MAKHLIFCFCLSENNTVSWGLYIIALCIYLHFTGTEHWCRQKLECSSPQSTSQPASHINISLGCTQMSLINLCEHMHSFCIPKSTLSFTPFPSLSHECLMALPAALCTWRQPVFWAQAQQWLLPWAGWKKKNSSAFLRDNKLAFSSPSKFILLWRNNMSHANNCPAQRAII